MTLIAEPQSAPSPLSSEVSPPVGRRRFLSSTARELFAVTGIFTVAAVLLWIFGGIDRLPTWEGWRVLDAFRQGSTGWWLTPASGSFAGNSLRPLEVLPHQIGYALSPDSFVGFNVVSLAAFVARGVAAYALIRELLHGHRPAAAVGALLFALSPAADGMMIDRTIHVQWAGALAVGGFAALMVAARTGRARLAVLAPVLVGASLLMYEAALPVALLMPVYAVITAVERRRALRMAALYAAGIAVVGCYSVWMRLSADSTYQNVVATTRRSMRDSEGISASLDALRWAFGGSVTDTLQNELPMARPALTTAGLLVALAVAVLGVVLVVLAARTPRRQADPVGWRGSLAPLALGVVWVGSSLVIFLPFLPYRYESLRVHSIAQFGVAVVLAALLKLLMSRSRPVALVVASGLLVVTSIVTVQNAMMWTKWSDFQSQLLSVVLAEAEASDARTVVITDHTDRLGHIYAMGPDGLYVGVAANFLAGGEPRRVVVCNTAPGVTAVGFAQMGPCSFTEDELVVESLPGFPDDRQVFRRSELLELELFGGDQPQLRRTDGRAPASMDGLSSRELGFLPCLVGQSCAERAVAAELPSLPVFVGFDRPYSYENVPDRGATVEGFGPPLLNGDSWRWTTSTDSAVYADLPEGSYVVRAHVLNTALPDAADTARLTLNGVPLATTVTASSSGAVTLQGVGVIGPSSPHADRIGITGPVAGPDAETNAGFGMAVDWISVDRAPD
jgi:hypothetical protein